MGKCVEKPYRLTSTIRAEKYYYLMSMRSGPNLRGVGMAAITKITKS